VAAMCCGWRRRTCGPVNHNSAGVVGLLEEFGHTRARIGVVSAWSRISPICPRTSCPGTDIAALLVAIRGVTRRSIRAVVGFL
jgi:hypothetical protein